MSPRAYGGRGRGVVIACGVALALGASVVSLVRPPLLANLDNLAFDAAARRERVPAGCRLPVVVGLDDEALARFGHWPWPRALVARLLDRLAELRPSAVGLDVLFPEPEVPSPNGSLALSEGDAALAASLARGPFVLGWEFTFAANARRTDEAPGPVSVGVAALGGAGIAEPAPGLWSATGAVRNLPGLARSVDSSGFLNAGLDPDGILRRIPVLIEHGGTLYPSLGLATVLKALGVRQAVLESRFAGGRVLRIGERRIPLDSTGRLLLRYRCQRGEPTQLSAAAVLEGRAPSDAVRGKVVFVGATASGLGESIATPVAPALPGVAAHAIAAGDILERDFARQGPAPLAALAVLGLGLAGTLAFLLLRAVPGALVLVAAAAGAWVGSGWLFRASGLVISPVLPVLTLGAELLVLTLVRVFLGERWAGVQGRDLAATREFVAESLASLAAIRDTETGTHIQRTQRYLRILCEAAAGHPRFRDALTPAAIELIAKLAPIHDIGKVGVPDDLLHKPSKLTAGELEQVKKHALYGRDAIANAERRVAVGDPEFLQIAKDLVYSHHERWDGSGYPEGLKGNAIPLPGRLMAIADVYDALVNTRVYKAALPHEEAVREIRLGRGTQFDPDLVDAFLTVERQWRSIHDELADPGETPPDRPAE